jgi:hypothetical protein
MAPISSHPGSLSCSENEEAMACGSELIQVRIGLPILASGNRSDGERFVFLGMPVIDGGRSLAGGLRGVEL